MPLAGHEPEGTVDPVNNTNDVDPRASAIADTRHHLAKLREYPGEAPKDLDEAIAIQDDVIRTLGETVCGWKIGCTSEVAQKALGADGPFFGPLIQSRRFESGAVVRTGPDALRVIEAEVALTLSRALSPREEAYSLNDVLAAVSHVHASLEIIDRRLPGGLDQGLTWNIADCGVNDAIVLGAGLPPLTPDDFVNLTVDVHVNGAHRTSGTGATALGGAHHALTWLANDFNKRGRTLKAGDTITTGLITEIFMAEPGDEIVANYSSLGTLKVTIQ